MSVKVFAISPHLDDAVFSVGGLLSRAASRGWECSIITCFTKSMPQPDGFALTCQTDKGLPANEDYMKIRREEDKNACHLINTHHHWLPFEEAPHRGYHSPKALFKDIHSEDTIHQSIFEALKGICDKTKPDIILYPVGFGNHVDHQQVILAVHRLREYYSDIRYYQWYDEPYYSKMKNKEIRPTFQNQAVNFDTIEEPEKKNLLRFTITSQISQKLQACKAYTTQFKYQFQSEEILHRIFRMNNKGEDAYYEYLIK